MDTPSGRTQRQLAGRRGPGWRAGTVQMSRDVIGVEHGAEHLKATAAVGADGHVDGEDASQETSPGEPSRPQGVRLKLALVGSEQDALLGHADIATTEI
jgi:hypothetical protein